jgi:hypothetical protein
MTESLLDGVEAEQEEKTIDQIEEEEYNKPEEEPEEVLKPEGLDDSLWDDENKSIKQDDIIEALNKEKEKALGLRRKLSEKGNVKPPKDVAEYELDESLNEILPSDSETTSLIKEKALDAGLTTDQFNNFMTQLMPALNEQGMIQPQEAELSEEEQTAQYEEFKNAELEKLGADGPQVLQTLANWGDSLVNRGVLSQDELPVFQDLAVNAESMVVLSKLRDLTGEIGIPVKTAVTDGLPSRAEIDNIIASPEYDNGDAKAHAKVKAYFEATT